MDTGDNDPQAAVRIAELAAKTRAEAEHVDDEEVREALLRIADRLDQLINRLTRPKR